LECNTATTCKRGDVTIDQFNYASVTALSSAGWFNGNLNADCPALTQFLGRFDSASPFPYKTYTIPPATTQVKVEFDFYQIDSWDGGTDSLRVLLNSLSIDLGSFQTSDISTPGHVPGTPVNRQYPTDVSVVLNTLKRTTPIVCFKTGDEIIHHVAITLPNKYFSTGKLTLELQTWLTDYVRDEASGFDNIKITILDCDMDRDGYPDYANDKCLGTPSGAKVDWQGCSGKQNVLKNCGSLCSDASTCSKSKYVTCVNKYASSQLQSGLLTSTQKDTMVSQMILGCGCPHTRNLRSGPDSDE